MGRAAIAKSKILMLRGAKVVERSLSKIAGADKEITKDRRTKDKDIKDSSSWVPHPKSGIYFPKGHEWVMNDVPDDAASLGSPFWLRNVDGVEKPDPDQVSSHHHYCHANM
ncbi:uncharacterized protein LOC110423543 [Herrania umbratica]|uniref:Uncharacterized protein LOC110423543 n=1 Tax=Herrania umbratica TaxID=108875 RepID=A0A6J1B487_9ROSI|nr:uncharacterized protein LOC110423543 [Herrania umbratica]